MNTRIVIVLVSFILAMISYGTSFLDDYNAIKDNVLFAVLYITVLTTLGYFLGVYLLQDEKENKPKKKNKKDKEFATIDVTR